jgi:uridine monophosphate synthetase
MSSNSTLSSSELALQLFEIGAIVFGTFTLKSGVTSPYYIDLRRIISYPTLLEQVSELMYTQVMNNSNKKFQIVCGVPYTAIPLATMLSVKNKIPMVMRRKEVKAYGLGKIIEGVYEKGNNCLVVEDLITSGLSISETITPLKEVGLNVTDIVVLIDREQGGKKRLEEQGLTLHAVLKITVMFEIYRKENKITEEQYQEALDFLNLSCSSSIKSPRTMFLRATQ